MSGAADLTGIAPIDVALSLLWFVGIYLGVAALAPDGAMVGLTELVVMPPKGALPSDATELVSVAALRAPLWARYLPKTSTSVRTSSFG